MKIETKIASSKAPKNIEWTNEQGELQGVQLKGKKEGEYAKKKSKISFKYFDA